MVISRHDPARRDMLTVDDLFIRDGFVLRFSDIRRFNDRTFAQFSRKS